MGDVIVHDLATGVARTVAHATVDWTPVAWSEPRRGHPPGLARGANELAFVSDRGEGQAPWGL